jgi:23S rRNA pseudouridine2604 synthase
MPRKQPIIKHEAREEIRLNKYIADSGLCSRREADELIANKKVTIDGEIAPMGTKVKPGQKVFVNRKPLPTGNDVNVYIALNKPVGITCTTDLSVKGNIVDFVGHEKRIYPIGRLDKDSQGLILMTNDGDIVNKILRARNGHEKEYVVTVNKPITDDFIRKMANGVPILETITKKCFVKREGKQVFRIILEQGLNRQIRRMCEYLGFEVTQLVRVRIMNIALGTLKEGRWRNLTPKELLEINQRISSSKK